jgi:hypothetical protein
MESATSIVKKSQGAKNRSTVPTVIWSASQKYGLSQPSAFVAASAAARTPSGSEPMMVCSRWDLFQTGVSRLRAAAPAHKRVRSSLMPESVADANRIFAKLQCWFSSLSSHNFPRNPQTQAGLPDIKNIFAIPGCSRLQILQVVVRRSWYSNRQNRSEAFPLHLSSASRGTR